MKKLLLGIILILSTIVGYGQTTKQIDKVMVKAMNIGFKQANIHKVIKAVTTNDLNSFDWKVKLNYSDLIYGDLVSMIENGTNDLIGIGYSKVTLHFKDRVIIYTLSVTENTL